MPGARALAGRGFKITRLLPLKKHEPRCDERYAEAQKVFGEAIPRSDCSCERQSVLEEPTDECVVVRLEASPKHGAVVVLRDVATLGTRTKLPSAVRVVRGDTKKSRIYREMTDPSYREVTKARRNKKETA